MAMRSPDGDGSIEIAPVYCDLQRIGRQVLAVVGGPLLIAERLEPVLQILLELLVELARVHLKGFFVRTRAAADGALAQREQELADAVFAPSGLDELIQRVPRL